MLSFFPRDVLDEIWDLIESVSEGFPIYSYSQCSRFITYIQYVINREHMAEEVSAITVKHETVSSNPLQKFADFSA